MKTGLLGYHDSVVHRRDRIVWTITTGLLGYHDSVVQRVDYNDWIIRAMMIQSSASQPLVCNNSIVYYMFTMDDNINCPSFIVTLSIKSYIKLVTWLTSG